MNGLIVIGALFLPFITALASPTMSTVQKVLVTGAGGKTGKLVLQKLLQQPEQFDPIGVVRTERSKSALLEDAALGIPDDRLVVADICDADAMERCCQGMDALIICTSATPAPTGEMNAEGRPKLGFPNGIPEQVDWLGQKNQIDAMKKCGESASHVVICSSMGGTSPENPLNKIGQKEDGSGGGNILLWKRKAEKYLIDSGLSYTIVHPGGLLDQEGGKRELVVGVNDEQLETENRSIPRTDVATVLVASLQYESYKNRSFDVRSKAEGDGTITTDFDKLLTDLKTNCDYSIGQIA